jgi:TonB-linked SusC/RagA family outer membrane protein
MKLTIIIIITFLLQVSASSHAQKVTLKEKNASLEHIISSIREQTGYDFIGNANLLNTAKPVSIDVHKVSLEEALRLCFENQDMVYTIEERTVVLKPKEKSVLTRIWDYFVQIEVRGTVKDSNGFPISGAFVSVKDGTQKVATNEQGNFIIRSIDADATLIFTMVGYTSQTIPLAGRENINVILTESNNRLDEVVVIGYGSAKKEDLTGSVSMVKVTDLANAPVASFDQALAGRVAGVQVSSNEGQPGGEGINIVIRGNGSLTQSNAPLYVVDGFPIEDFDNGALNNDDIASINILKDASATAIYGARGANGVIIIETKKGKLGAPEVSYNGSYGSQEIAKRMEMMNTYEFVKYQIDRGNGASYLTDDRTADYYSGVKGVNWQDQLFRRGSTQIHNIAVRGGTAQTKYSISGSVYNSDAIIINTGYDRYQGRISLDQTFNNKFKTGINLNYSKQSYFGREASVSTGSASSNLLYATLGYRPVTGSIDFSEDDLADNIIDEDVNGLEDYRVNPIISTQNEYRNVVKDNLITNAYVSYEFIKGLTFKATGGINYFASESGYFYNSKTSRGTPLIPTNSRGQWGGITNSGRTALSNENTLTYEKKIDKNHSIDIVGGFSIQKSSNKSSGFVTTNIPNESLGINGLGDGVPFSNATRASVFTLQSYLSRINYNYKSKYLLTASFRADGSSKFIKANRWGYFSSGAFAWRMSKEPFMQNINFISDGKLRVSYGLTGNNRVSDFATRAVIDPHAFSSYAFGNESPTMGVQIPSLGNPTLKWETTKQIDLGYDLSLFKNRVELTVDVYRKTTVDLLLNASMPGHTGFTTIYKNIGNVENKGLEITLNTINIRKRDFTWESNFNISFNKNKILALAEGEDNIRNNIAWENSYDNTPLYISKIGQPAGQMYGYLWDGIYQYSDFNENLPGVYTLKNNVPTNNNDRTNITIKPGDIKYKDLNADGVINDFDKTIIGKGLPVHTGGFSNNFSYKGIRLGVFLQWSYGNDLLNANKLIFEGSSKQNLNQFASYINRWTPENQSNDHYRIGGQGPSGTYSSKVVEDGSYLRLKTLFLGYSLPKKMIKWARMKDIAFTLAAQNLITWTGYSGFDPEVSTKNSTLTPGFDYSAYPHARTVVFGIKASL